MGDWMDRWRGHGGLAPHVEGEVMPASGGCGGGGRLSSRFVSIQ